ncbi:hypothetical protein D3C85_719220 [compost metagenome]
MASRLPSIVLIVLKLLLPIPNIANDLIDDECGVAVKILIGSEIPFLAKSFPSCFPNHCLATPKQVKFDIVAPVTNPPKNVSGNCNN